MKKTIRLNENELKELIKETVDGVMDSLKNGTNADELQELAIAFVNMQCEIENWLGSHGISREKFNKLANRAASYLNFIIDQIMDKEQLKEALDELSPELLAHASKEAQKQGRTFQGYNLDRGAMQAFNRDYGWENKDTRNPEMTTSFGYPGAIDIFYNGKYSQKPKDGYKNETHLDVANRYLKPAQRSRYLKGLDALIRMRNGQHPDGTHYDSDDDNE